jgi:hypothetical protein
MADGKQQQASGGGSGDFPGAVIARLLNITERRLQQLAREGIVPKSSRGKYPLAGCIRGYIRFLQESDGDADNQNPDRMEPFKRKAFYQAEHEKLMLQVKAGDLLSRAEVEAQITHLFARVSDFLDALPDRLERDGLLDGDGAQRVEGYLDRARTELHGEVLGGIESADTSEAAG